MTLCYRHVKLRSCRVSSINRINVDMDFNDHCYHSFHYARIIAIIAWLSENESLEGMGLSKFTIYKSRVQWTHIQGPGKEWPMRLVQGCIAALHWESQILVRIANGDLEC